MDIDENCCGSCFTHRLTWREKVKALFRRSSYRPFFLMMTYFVFTQLAGISVIIMWTVEILERSKSSVDPNFGNLLLGITRLLAGILTSVLIFKLARRPLAISSGLGCGVICVALGFHILYTKEKTIIPQISFMAYIVFATLGHYTLPVLIMYELYPLQIRGVLGGISTAIINFSIFGVNVLYPYSSENLGFANTIIAFGVFSLLGCIYLYFFLPETKDLTLQEIEEYYNDRRSTLTSQRRILSMQLSKQVLSRSDTASKSLVKITDKHKKDELKRNKSKASVSTGKKSRH